MKDYLSVGFWCWVLVFLPVLLWSAIEPYDRLTWFLETVPAIAGALLMLWTRASFPLTSLLYIWILLHCIVLMIGGHYTYALVPFFDGPFFVELFDSTRNNYDKLGHFFQGFVPALLAREILVRKNVVSTAAWRNLFVISVCLAFSAFYELIEWWVALAAGADSESFLGTQGYVWDTQSDMALALLGAISCVLLLSNWHDRQLRNLLSRT